jgi:ribosome-binding protein aMBF1 (putative translation factor)
MTITGDQVKAARGLLNWSRWQLAAELRVSSATIGKFERTGWRESVLDLPALRRVLEAEGIEFVVEDPDGPDVRMRKAGK